MFRASCHFSQHLPTAYGEDDRSPVEGSRPETLSVHFGSSPIIEKVTKGSADMVSFCLYDSSPPFVQAPAQCVYPSFSEFLLIVVLHDSRALFSLPFFLSLINSVSSFSPRLFKFSSHKVQTTVHHQRVTVAGAVFL